MSALINAFARNQIRIPIISLSSITKFTSFYSSVKKKTFYLIFKKRLAYLAPEIDRFGRSGRRVITDNRPLSRIISGKYFLSGTAKRTYIDSRLDGENVILCVPNAVNGLLASRSYE